MKTKREKEIQIFCSSLTLDGGAFSGYTKMFQSMLNGTVVPWDPIQL